MADLKNVKLTINVPFPFELSFARQQVTKFGPSLMIVTANDECFWLPVDAGNTLIAAGASTKQTEKGMVYDGVKGKRFVAHKTQGPGQQHATVTLEWPDGQATAAELAPHPDDFKAPPKALQTPPEPMPWDGDAKEPPVFQDSELVRKYDECLTWAIGRCSHHNTGSGVKLPMMGADAAAIAATLFIQRMKVGA